MDQAVPPTEGYGFNKELTEALFEFREYYIKEENINIDFEEDVQSSDEKESTAENTEAEIQHISTRNITNSTYKEDDELEF